MAIKTAKELATAAEKVAKNYKTLYVMGCFGWPMTASMKARAKKEQSYNRKSARAAKIDAADSKTFGFDCVNLIKALLWGWSGDASKNYGGASYGSNGVPDVNDSLMIKACNDVSTDFSNIQVGEVVWLEGHIGVYIGNGLAVEATPSWKDGVQITAVHNIGKKSGYNGRSWTKHGKLPYVTYEEIKEESTVNVELKVLKKGAKGNSVKAMQALLIGYGYNCGSTGVDGSYGNATEKALHQFKKDNNLKVTSTCGEQTWNKLLGKS